MTIEQTLADEIKELESKALGTPLDKPSDSTETTEVKGEAQETEGTPEETQAPEETFESAGEATAQEAETTETVETKPARTNWKRKYEKLDLRFRNMKASNDVTIHTLRVDLSTALKTQGGLSDKVDTLSKELAELRVSSSDPLKDVLSTEEREVIGEETLEALNKISEASVESRVKPLQEQLAEERSRRSKELEEKSELTATQAHNDFLRNLGSLVPDYSEIDKSSEFLSWMKGPDDLSGAQREMLFKKAQGSGDVGRVAQFFVEFKKVRDVGKNALDKKVTPTTSASNTSQQAVNTPPRKSNKVSLAKVEVFLNNLAKGEYDKNPKFVKEIQDQIDEAHRTGNIVP